MKHLILLSLLSSSLYAQEPCIKYEDSPQYDAKMIILKGDLQSCKREMSQRPTGSEMGNILWASAGVAVGIALGVIFTRPRQ